MKKHWLSPAKLNLFLYITGRRPDNYHNLQTLFQFIDYCDNLTFEVRQDDQINLLTTFEHIPVQENLIVIAAKRLQDYAQKKNLGVDISIDKKIPMGGGLGGASSNAATVLIALNQLWQLNLSIDSLMTIGRTIGADVPIFIYGHSAFAEGIGDEFYSVDIPEYWYLVTCPEVEISTAKIFNDPELTRNTPVRQINDLLSLPFDKLKNDCEDIVRKRYSHVDEVITYLSQYTTTRLTGTGSCVFSQFKTQKEAQNVQEKLSALSLKSFIAKAMNHSPLFDS